MCLATVYIEDNGQRRQVMEDVAWIKPENHGLQLVTFLGESRRFRNRIKSVDLINGSIILEAEASE